VKAVGEGRPGVSRGGDSNPFGEIEANFGTSTFLEIATSTPWVEKACEFPKKKVTGGTEGGLYNHLWEAAAKERGKKRWRESKGGGGGLITYLSCETQECEKSYHEESCF